MTSDDEFLRAARAGWRWRGDDRPPFAVTPGPGQRSVWDFPRPPRVEPEPRRILVRWGQREVADTDRAVRVLETAHPPTYYLPWSDVDRTLFVEAGGGSFCEWKGPARHWSLVDGARRLERVAWSYPQPLAGSEAVAEAVALYAWPELACTVGGAIATPQPGGFYGGWVTPELVGPIKGVPGSAGW
jgi:uncharacterized protein (DUF427 family)